MTARLAAGDHLAWAVVLAGLAVLAVAGYAAACWLWPFRACLRCGGTGKRRSPGGKAFGLCRRCKGTARRLRFGRRAWEYSRRARAGG